jgi:glucose uptake protein GlcU
MLSRILQFIGIVLVGVGLIYGVAQNDMANEMLFAIIGLVVFVVGRSINGRK